MSGTGPKLFLVFHKYLTLITESHGEHNKRPCNDPRTKKMQHYQNLYMLIQVLQEMKNAMSSTLLSTKAILLFIQGQVIFQLIIQLFIYYFLKNLAKNWQFLAKSTYLHIMEHLFSTYSWKKN